MGFMGGLGAGKGWLICQFVLVPEEIGELFRSAAALLLVTNARVPVACGQTTVEDYVGLYARHLNGGVEDQNLHISLLRPDTPFRWKSVPGGQYKLVELDEPVVHVKPFSLNYGADGRLYSHFLDFSGEYAGLELNFPRVGTMDSDRHSHFHDTSDARNAKLFADLRNASHAMTSPAVFSTPAGEKRIKIRVSAAGAAMVSALPLLTRQKIQIRPPK